LEGGMKESQDKEIVIDDIKVEVFEGIMREMNWLFLS